MASTRWRGFQAANALARDEAARLIVLRSQAWSWSDEKLSAFLLQHDAYVRNSRCTCSSCPLHSTHEHTPNQGED